MRTCLFLLTLFVSACTAPTANEARSDTYTSVYWSDGDSGRLGEMKFRLSNVDAPETGGVGSRGGAKCEAERVRGYDAKAFIVGFTSGKTLKVTASYGQDRYKREVVDLSADGVDVASAAVEAGYLAVWPHDGRRALSDKPDWCGPRPD